MLWLLFYNKIIENMFGEDFGCNISYGYWFIVGWVRLFFLKKIVYILVFFYLWGIVLLFIE